MLRGLSFAACGVGGFRRQYSQRMPHVAQHTFDVQRQLRWRNRYQPQRGLRARLHFGASFLLLVTHLHVHVQAKGTAALSSRVQ